MKYRKIAVMMLSMALTGAAGIAVQAAETETSAQEQMAEDGAKENDPAEDGNITEETNVAEDTDAAGKADSTGKTDSTGKADSVGKADNTGKTDVTDKTDSVEDSEITEEAAAPEDENAFDDRIAVQIMLEGTTAKAGSESVRIDGTTVTITEGGTYILSGSLSDGQIVVDAGDTARVILILNDVRITNDGKDVIAVKSADEVTVTLSDGSKGTLSAGADLNPAGKQGYADDYDRDLYGYGDEYGYREDYGYWDEEDDQYPDREDYGYWDEEDDRYPEWNDYGYWDEEDDLYPEWDEYGYRNAEDDWYRYYDEGYYDDPDREDYIFRDTYRDQSEDDCRCRSGDSRSNSQTAPPEGRMGRGTHGSSGRRDVRMRETSDVSAG